MQQKAHATCICMRPHVTCTTTNNGRLIDMMLKHAHAYVYNVSIRAFKHTFIICGMTPLRSIW